MELNSDPEVTFTHCGHCTHAYARAIARRGVYAHGVMRRAAIASCGANCGVCDDEAAAVHWQRKCL